jgi:p-methyltransferase
MDCIVVGYNEPELEKVVNDYGIMSRHTGAYRHMLQRVARIRGRWMHYSDILNTIVSEAKGESLLLHPMQMPNLAVCYLKSFLKQRQFDIETINFYNAEKERFQELMQARPTAVAITTSYYISDAPVIKLVRIIRKISEETKIIIGGPYVNNICLTSQDVTTQDYIFEKLGADIYINSSQGELTLSRVLSKLRKDKEGDLKDIPNLIFRSVLQREANSKGMKERTFRTSQYHPLVRTPLKREENDLSKNCIDWDLFSPSLYTPTALMRTAHGCAFECAFCSFPSMAGRLAYSTMDTIRHEMKQLCDAGVRYLMFIDDTFNVPLSRFKKILRMMIDNKFRFNWFSFFRCSHVDDEAFDLMEKSGCKGVLLGIESGDQGMLDNMNKKVRVEQYRSGIGKLHERGIFTFVSVIVGFPGETETSVQNTINFLEETAPTFYKSELYFHTHYVPVNRQAGTYGLKGSGFSWSHSTMNWQTACDQIELMIRSVKRPQFCSGYMFSFWMIPYMLGKGISLKQIKQFLNLCRPLLLRNFDSLTPANGEKYYQPLFALGKEIADNLEKGAHKNSCSA